MAEQPLGELRTRSSVAISDPAVRGRLVTSIPFMALEVHDQGVVVRADPRRLSRVRHFLTLVLEPILRPIPFLLGDRIGCQPPHEWTMSWEGIARVTHAGGWRMTLETAHGSARAIRFRSRRGLRATLDELRAHGVAVDDPRRRS